MVNFGYVESNPWRPVDSRQLARVSTLLDEAAEGIEGSMSQGDHDRTLQVRSIAKIREAQAILLGERPTHPEEN